MVKPTQDINHLIAQKIGITVEDLKTTLSVITRTWEIAPDLLEVVKVWRFEQTVPIVCDWWEILVYKPIVDINNEYYLLYEISDWGEDSRDSVQCVEGDSSPIETLVSSNNCTVELLFENNHHEHDPDDYD
ncbi:MAG: hypothetical protein AB4372_00325 [Xenococcus sp. (in: cyanobacteria)]